jgi:CRP-like cAMP-binding protein
MAEGIIDCLGTVPLFRELSSDALGDVCSQLRHFSLHQGEMLFQQGDPGNSMFIVDDGTLRVYTLGEGGRQVLLDVLGPGDVLGELTLLDGRPRTAYAQAETDCEIFALDREPFLAHLMERPDVAIALLSNVSMRLRQTVVQAEVVSARGSASRLAHVILFLADRDGELQTGLVTSRLNRKDIAAAIGTSEEWVTHMLTEWSRDGIIGMTGMRRLILHDIEALRAITRQG